ncbi:putative NADH:ubiquinone reductase (H(+)-translocating) [Candidatus Saccharimonas aalborgensis]|uniref:Putative NADH:ubiquinone reductase (H(+)-translocating) n=1 Tax=Candidatus Saccharimonas aalborgensis TaxID=1332188 RepID=R4PVP2_9BACT|nr:FAD-dependent oxidoreductase [Candidatus Saccharimonas aalborgensis]AGL61812.1 putative NADH:ubiquinone reductase (H(+)-translocating) [Candidatus Saccharimonas aalborgensis]QQS70666.1 MAG: FAD-dependent oxidoreductase [Candidatus Saccharibacteria bacterium]
MNIIIVGGGFGGIKAALELSKDSRNHITLISDSTEFQYYPTLYSSATGHSHLESWAPLGEIFAESSNVEVYIDTITSIDVEQKVVGGESGTSYHYEVCIIAIGVVTTYFGIPGLETYAYGIKSEEEIKRLKRRLSIDIAENHHLDKNYIIIGGGPTGVELSAAMGTYLKRLMKRYHIRERTVNIRLVEAMPRILPRLSEQTSRRVTRRLKKLGVRVETGKKVERETAHELIVSGASIDSHTVIWTSGVTNHPFFANNPSVFRLAKNGRVEVDQYLQANKDIYVIGDNAATPFTGLAQTAIHDARTVARNLKRQTSGRPMKPYKAILPVQAIPVGARWAIVEWRWLRFCGWIGGLIRRVADLVGYSEVLPLGTSLGAWRAAKVYEDDYFAPTIKVKKRR